MSGSTAPILVTGATGRHGSTGAHVARRLLEEGRPVRILARTPGERTDALAALGAEVVAGDLHDRRSLVTALADVDEAYFTYPVEAGIVSAAANYTAAVRESGRAVRTVVMSMGPSNPLHPSDLGRAQWLAEEVMTWGGLDVLVLRVMATFHQNLLALHGDSIRRDGLLRNSFGDGPVGWINGRDAGELAVAALLRPAAILTEELGRSITFEPVSAQAWREDLVQLADEYPGGVVNTAMAGHISNVGEAVAARGAPPADCGELARLIDRTPLSLREFIRANREVLEVSR
jgi:uncharacterized protein YbjT (DUF2867 family)